jgi:O-antigen ligase
MELAAAVGIGFLMNRGNAWSRKATGAALLLVSGVGVVLSKSRGGGLSLVVMAAAALVWGFSQWRAYYRWCYRLSVGALAVVFLILFVNHSSGYMDRAANYPIFSALSGKPPGEWPAIIADVLPATDRGIMIRGALRAWRANPAWGIGPGMHQVLWPRFAATADGDRELGIWPRETNEHFHSYEVHSDWVQLLEEYGLAGFALFATASVAGFAALLLLHAFIGRDARRLKNPGRAPARIPANAALAAILAATAMAFHSLGDFNLQMPATGWMLAAIVALPFAVYRRPEPR